MFGQQFYFSLTRKYVILFGTLFNDIFVGRRVAGNTADVVMMKVPIQYANKEKMLSRIDGDPNIDRPFAVSLPRMSFEYTGWSYDGNRSLPSINRVVKKVDNDSNKLKYQYMPTPWNLNFNLYIYAKKQEDGVKIIEQILPFFKPTWTTTVELIPEMDVTLDIPITIKDIALADTYEGQFVPNRTIVWTLSFTLMGYYFGPVKQTGIIKIANTTFYIANTVNIEDSVGNVEPGERVIVSPGLDANGDPVYYYGTYPANTTSIPYSEIEEDDDWGIIETTESTPLGIDRPIGGNSTFSNTQVDNE